MTIMFSVIGHRIEAALIPFLQVYGLDEKYDEQKYKKQVLDSDGGISVEFGRVGTVEISEL